jgi:hypothetical protein
VTDVSLAGCNRQTDGERRAALHALTGSVHGSPVQLNEPPNDGQPETESGVTSCRRAIGLAEAVEHEWQKVQTETLACVDDPDLHLVVRPFDEDINRSALRRELDRIREQTPDHLLESTSRRENSRPARVEITARS